MKFRHLPAVFALLALFATFDSHAALIHQYELNGSLKDQKGGPDLVANGGTLGATGYAFKPNQGLQLQEYLGGEYTIDFVFHFDALNLWRKIVDFNDLSADAGFYAYTASLTFFNLGGTNGKLAPGVDTRLTMTRSAGNLFSVYQDGTLIGAMNDRNRLADLSAHKLNFFRDDRGGSEAGPGAVDFIHIYDKALSAAEVNALVNPQPVPEPASGLLMAGGLGLLGLARRRRMV